MASSPPPLDEMAFLADNAAEVGLTWTGPPPVRRTTTEVSGGRQVAALRWGDGAAETVLVHGRAQNAHTWDTVALALPRPLLAVDLPGHGRSQWRSDHDYSPAALAVDLATVIDALAPSAGMVVGVSLGGLTALALSRIRPDLVRRLVLVDITPGVDPAKVRAIAGVASGPECFAAFEEMLDCTAKLHPQRSLSSLRRGVLHNAWQGDDGAWRWRWDPIRSAEAGALQDSSERLWDCVARLAVPLTLARGARSTVVADEDAAELLRLRPPATVLVVDGAGHNIQGDQPLALAKVIDWVSGQPA